MPLCLECRKPAIFALAHRACVRKMKGELQGMRAEMSFFHNGGQCVPHDEWERQCILHQSGNDLLEQAVPHLARGRRSRQLCGRICKRLGIPVPPLPRKGANL